MRIDLSGVAFTMLVVIFATIFYLDYFTTPADGFDNLMAAVLLGIIAGFVYEFIPEIKNVLYQYKCRKIRGF